MKVEFKIIIIYLLIGFFWLYFSDRILLLYIENTYYLKQFQTFSGLFYLLFSAFIFYFLFKKYLNDLRKKKSRLEVKRKELIESKQKINIINKKLDFSLKSLEKLNRRFTKELISSIIKVLEIYDEYTKGHSENVANLSMLIAEKMGLSVKTSLDAYWAGMVHDIGKLLVPVKILNKTELLEDYEYDIIKEHPVWSSRALADSETLKHISNYVLYHHERWDGNGYPEGLAAEDIPLVSQIIAVADAWDAMTSNRSYRNSLSKKEAVKEIKKNKGSQFSPRAADAFLSLIDKKELDLKQEVSSKFEILENEESKFDKSII